jgi:hypothetical protein
MKRTFLFRIPSLRIETAYMRARCALQKAQGSQHASRFLSIVNHDIKRIRREPLAWATPVATLLGASAAFCEGRRDEAATALQRAADEFARADMHCMSPPRIGVSARSRRRRRRLRTIDPPTTGWRRNR